MENSKQAKHHKQCAEGYGKRLTCEPIQQGLVCLTPNRQNSSFPSFQTANDVTSAVALTSRAASCITPRKQKWLQNTVEQ